MPAFQIMYRGVFIKASIATFIFLLYAATVIAVNNASQERENYFKQSEETQKQQVSIEIKENNIFFQAVSDIVASKGDKDSRAILSRAKDISHKAIILNAGGNHTKALDKITESTDLIVIAINKVEDGISSIKDKELQQRIEGRLNKALARLKAKMSLLLTQNETFQSAAVKALQKKRGKESMDLMEKGKGLKEKAVAAMVDGGDYEKFKEYIKKSTNDFIMVVALADGEEQNEKTLSEEEVGIIIKANRSLINAASDSLTGADGEDATNLFKNALRLRKDALVLYSQGDYEKAVEDIKKSNDFAIKIIRLSIGNVQS